MSDNNIIDQAEKNINSYQAKSGTGKQSDSGMSPSSFFEWEWS